MKTEKTTPDNSQGLREAGGRRRSGGRNGAARMAAGLALAAAAFFPGRMLLAASPEPVDLGTAGRFAILAGSSISSTGGGIVNGDVGLSPGAGSSITGLTGAQVNGIIYCVDATGPAGSVAEPGMLTTARVDFVTAYTNAAGRTLDQIPVSGDIGGDTLVPGLYASSSSLGITGILTLDALGDPDAVWIFQIASTLITAAGVGPASQVVLAGGAQAKNIFWQVGSSATIGTFSIFKGTILADLDITLDTSSDVEGRLLAGRDITYNGQTAGMSGVSVEKTVSTDGSVPGLKLAEGVNGTPATYTFVVCSAGLVTLTNVSLIDNDIGYVTNLGTVVAGQCVTVTAVRAITGNLTNLVTVSGTDALGELHEDSDTAEVVMLPDPPAFFTVTKTDTPDPVRPGEALTYIVWVSNPSESPVLDVVVTETYDPLFLFANSLPAPSSGNNVWSLGDLAPGAMIPIVISGTVSGSAPSGTLLNNLVTVETMNAGTNTAEEVTLVAVEPPPGRTEIRVTKSDDVDPVQPGAALTYTIRVENLGPETAQDVVVTETYDPQFTFLSATPPPTTSNNVWALGDLAANTSVEIVVSGQVSGLATNGDVLVNRVLARASNARWSRDTEVTLVGPQIPVVITKTASADPVQARAILVYTVTVANVSSVGVVSNVTVVENYDSNFLFLSSDPPPLPGTDNVWYLGDLPPNFTTNIVITGRVSWRAMRRDRLFNTAMVISPNGSRTVHLSTRVFNEPPIPVTLLYFRAVTVARGIKLKWETSTEFENLGFNLYRAESAGGRQVRLNAHLLPGANSLDGQFYKIVDATAEPGVAYYYWLEEVSWDYQLVRYGPAFRPAATTAGLVRAGPERRAWFRTSTTGGLYRVRYETLVAAGLPMGTLNPNRLGVRVHGRALPVFANASGPVMKPGDSLLFYAPSSTRKGLFCTVTEEAEPARMGTANASLLRREGEVYMARAWAKQQVRFTTDPAFARYFLAGFKGVPVWVVDVTNPTNTFLLYGYNYVELEDGQTAVYLSYGPEDGPARCLAVQDEAVLDVPRINRP